METTTMTLRIPISLEEEINALALKSGINKNKIGNQCLRNPELKILHNINDLLKKIEGLESRIEKYALEGLPALKKLEKVLEEYDIEQ